MKKFGIILEQLLPTQLVASAIYNINQIILNTTHISPIIFINDYYRPFITPLCPIMQHQEIWGFDAPVIATNIYTANLLLQAPRPTKKYFYVWNLEWLYQTTQIFSEYEHVYYNTNLHLIARSEEHNNILTNNWQQPQCIMRDFDYEQLTTIISTG